MLSKCLFCVAFASLCLKLSREYKCYPACWNVKLKGGVEQREVELRMFRARSFEEQKVCRGFQGTG